MLQYMEPRNARALVPRLASPRLACFPGLHTHTGYKVFFLLSYMSQKFCVLVRRRALPTNNR